MSINVYVYIYIYIERESKERDMESLVLLVGPAMVLDSVRCMWVLFGRRAFWEAPI